MNKNDNQFKRVTSRILLTMFVLFSLIACGPKNNSSVQSETAAVESTPVLLQEINNTIEAKTQNTETIAQPVDLTDTKESKAIKSTVKLNPPHGEPEHRCDIAVGAPLDSPAKSTSIQTTTVKTSAPANSTANTAANTSVPVNTATVNTSGGQRVGPTLEKAKDFKPTPQFSYIPLNNTRSNQTAQLNPPHGQPGHRCDIPVGDPLPTTSANNSVKINPAHGQPGHRCDIPVGDPLPS